MTESAPRLSVALGDRYRLERELGAGGMATVYLAQDLKHHRKVAVKVLRPELAAVIGAERFLTEIRTTANLQHPHILPLHDSGEAGAFLFYVMPYVEGESLRDRLNREKQLPINDAVRIASEVASALDYAHRHGVIHRDIKPENILLHDGSALVADFGIALAVSSAGATRMTETGMSLGTPHYMSPEQAMGEREIGPRSDVYALGAVTYEMLVGEPPFTGPTAQSIGAKVVTEEPRPLMPKRHTIPPHVDAAVLRALEKLPADRFAGAAEFATALASPMGVGVPTARKGEAGSRTAAVRSYRRSSLILPVVLALTLLATWIYVLTHKAPAAQPLRASILPPIGCAFEDVGSSNLIQVSPDGGVVAFIATCGGGQALWIRSLRTGEVHQLAGTANAAYPFWSPDGTSLGFFADAKLKRIDLQSGAVRELASALNGRGGSWNGSNVILYAPDILGPLYRLGADGATPEPATAMPAGKKNVTHRLPYFLPDGDQFLFSEGALNSVDGTVRVGRLGSLESRLLLNFPANVAYAHGRLLYARAGLLMTHPFDPGKATVSGTATSLVPGLETWPFRYLGNFSVATSSDLLVYRPPPGRRNRVEWFDPVSGSSTAVLEPGPYGSVRVSPDGGRIVIERSEGDNPLVDIWLYEVSSRTWTRLTSRPDLYYEFAWSPDGKRLATGAAGSATGSSQGQIIALGDGESEALPDNLNATAALDWAPDGSYLVGWRQVQATGFDLMLTSLLGATRTQRILYSTPADERAPRISPDGRLLAYTSNQSGRNEVYLTRMPEAKIHAQVSENGAFSPQGFRPALAWKRGGGVLYFLGASHQLMSVTVAAGPVLHVGRPTVVPGAPPNIVHLDAAPNGRLPLVCDEAQDQAPLAIIEHWTALMRAP
jgi:Tol biopolymer transport system component/tRNA A-37 threonylcarbamoyl transferase component Bud32